MSNMDLWNKVSKTDPRHTKDVSLGRKFTAIDAHYQVMRATETFGPVGQGWGYTVEHSTVTAGSIVLAAADVIVWHGDRSNCFGPGAALPKFLTPKESLMTMRLRRRQLTR
ncbi:hypothetical protein [Paludibacterium denitrificans]|uniref:Uncharacterized protein n=1 Tax=Paludibacterium denitrificans TaxID=2675226 RepID=A0A844GHM7_9NEIS|nr:hypothetical protein [Paludibacterium denitrificans]MTD33995.1 hypothetical protein [Paludibacterium denitrificans]